MYHYYVRYSMFSKGKKIGDGSTELTTKKKITQKNINKLIENLKEDERKYFFQVDDVIIDFYQLLGRSFR